MKLKLVVIGGKKAGMEIPILMPKCVIGRGDDCHIRPQSQLVSRRHCVISTDNGSATIEDCGSANGTLVNREKVQRRRELKNTDRITIGTLELEVQLAADEAAVHVLQEGQSHSYSSSVGVHRNVVSAARVGPAPGKPLPSKGGEKKQPTPNMRSAASRTVAPAAILDGEVDLLGWLDGKNNGEGKKVVLPVAKRVAKTLSPTAHLPKGQGSHTETPRPQSGDRSCIGGPIPLVGGGKSVGVALAGEENDDRAAADLLAEIDGPLDDLLGQSSNLPYDLAGQVGSPLDGSVWQVGNLPHDEWDVSGLLEGEDQPSKEWEGTDLLLMAALGLLLVFVLSWLFPMSWPEGFSLGGWLRWCLQNWWHRWWLRWGAVVILVAALMKLLCIRARLEKRG